jgi:hypothetical protein
MRAKRFGWFIGAGAAVAVVAATVVVAAVVAATEPQ